MQLDDIKYFGFKLLSTLISGVNRNNSLLYYKKNHMESFVLFVQNRFSRQFTHILSLSCATHIDLHRGIITASFQQLSLCFYNTYSAVWNSISSRSLTWFPPLIFITMETYIWLYKEAQLNWNLQINYEAKLNDFEQDRQTRRGMSRNQRGLFKPHNRHLAI